VRVRELDWVAMYEDGASEQLNSGGKSKALASED